MLVPYKRLSVIVDDKNGREGFFKKAKESFSWGDIVDVALATH